MVNILNINVNLFIISLQFLPDFYYSKRNYNTWPCIEAKQLVSNQGLIFKKRRSILIERTAISASTIRLFPASTIGYTILFHPWSLDSLAWDFSILALLSISRERAFTLLFCFRFASNLGCSRLNYPRVCALSLPEKALRRLVRQVIIFAGEASHRMVYNAEFMLRDSVLN